MLNNRQQQQTNENVYEKPMIEVISFDIESPILSGSGVDISGGNTHGSSGDWM